MTINELRQKCDPWMKLKPGQESKYEEFWKLNHYTSGNYDSKEDFVKLDNELKMQENGVSANRLFYLALPPSVFEPVTIHIRSSCMGQKFVLAFFSSFKYYLRVHIPRGGGAET